MPYTKTNGQSAYALDYQNEYMAARGTFWESGGDATLGASATEPIVNIGAVTVRIEDAEYSTGSESQVILAENNGSTPRKDLIVAEKPASGDTADPPDVHAIAGTPIADEIYQAITDENGELVADPPALPEVQPPAGAALKGVATPLHVIHVPPGTTDSTDLSTNGLEDVRKEGVGVSNVLRSGDAVAEIESQNDTIETSVRNSQEFAGRTRGVLATEGLGDHVRGGVGASSQIVKDVWVPDGKQVEVWGMGVVDTELSTPDHRPGLVARFQRVNNDGSRLNLEVVSQDWRDGGGEAIQSKLGPGLFSYGVANNSDQVGELIGRFVITISDA